MNIIHIQKVDDIESYQAEYGNPGWGWGNKITLSELEIFKPVEEIYIHNSKQHLNLRIEKVEQFIYLWFI